MASSTLQSRIVIPTNLPDFEPPTISSTPPNVVLPRALFELIFSRWRDRYADDDEPELPECNKMGYLLNFNVTETCFLHEDWYNSSDWMFALTCLAVVSLVFTLEALRLALRRYDEKLVHGAAHEVESPTVGDVLERRRTRPSASHQAVRALIYMAIVIVAYVLILFAVSFNGFILLTIFVSSYFAFFLFTPLHTTTRSAVTP